MSNTLECALLNLWKQCIFKEIMMFWRVGGGAAVKCFEVQKCFSRVSARSPTKNQLVLVKQQVAAKLLPKDFLVTTLLNLFSIWCQYFTLQHIVYGVCIKRDAHIMVWMLKDHIQWHVCVCVSAVALFLHVCTCWRMLFLVTGASAYGKSDGQAGGGVGGGERPGRGGQRVHEGHRLHQPLQEHEGNSGYALFTLMWFLYGFSFKSILVHLALIVQKRIPCRFYYLMLWYC